MLPTALALATVLACGGKKAAPEAAAAPTATETRGGLTGDYPSDAASQAFATSLIGLTIENFAAVDGVGAKVMMTSLRFAGDNTWGASGYVDAGEERMECAERGTWTMDPASSRTEATITWTVESTDCIGRESGTQVRALLTINGDDVAIAFR